MVVATVVVTLLVVPGGTWMAMDQRRSALRTTPDGVAAWARSLERLGVPVANRFTSFAAEPPGGAGLVLLEPVQPPSAAEVHEALTWVREGGVMVYSPSFGALVLDSLGLGLSRRFVGPTADGPPGVSRLSPHRWTADVPEDTLLATWAVVLDSSSTDPWTPLATLRDSAATLAWLPRGTGGVLVVAEARTLANGSLASSSVATVVTRAVADLLGPGDTLFFSEYHQGQGGGRGFFRETYAIAVGTPVGRVLLHASAAALALLLLSGRRFGAPVPEPERDRRSPLEHLDALGRIYREASSDHAVARRLVLGAVRRSGQRPPGADDEVAVLEAWSRRPELAGSSRLALAALQRDPPDLPRLVTALDRIVDEHRFRYGRHD